jgi:hypothetical protein
MAETDCACGEYHADVSGFFIRNPLRDPSPERVASSFFQDLRAGRCPLNAAVEACRYAQDGHLVSDWKLMNRRDEPDRSLLFYKLTKRGEEFDPKYRLSGEGLVEVATSAADAHVIMYSSYF